MLLSAISAGTISLMKTTLRPFHHAFLVKDIASTRKFYAGTLRCREGRSTKTWIDFDFFGNQISAHISKRRPKPVKCGHVDSVIVPIPHFGAILTLKEFRAMSARLRKARTKFVIAPTLRYKGKVGEQMTMFLYDPSGNALEFKAFSNPKDIYAS